MTCETKEIYKIKLSTMGTNIVKIQDEIKKELADPKVLSALASTTFKGLKTPQVFLAIQEGMIRGFTFKDFLEKNVYAIPFLDGYSLITSIDFARKRGMRSGVVGKSAPEFKENDNKIISCSITIKRKVGGYVGDYTAMVYFDEYAKPGRNGKLNLWDTKPHTMIAKVAEMHALRMACPEELAENYIVEEMEKEKEIAVPQIDLAPYKASLEAAKDEAEMKKVWASMPVEAKEGLKEFKNELKKKYENPKV
jgi:hypothetical protein